jgi:acetylornithine aminotransferase
MAKKFPLKGPWGVGAMIAFTYKEGDQNEAVKLAHTLYDAGVIGFTAGKDPTRIRFLMPVGAITTAEVDEVCKIIEEVLTRFTG